MILWKKKKSYWRAVKGLYSIAKTYSIDRILIIHAAQLLEVNRLDASQKHCMDIIRDLMTTLRAYTQENHDSERDQVIRNKFSEITPYSRILQEQSYSTLVA